MIWDNKISDAMKKPKKEELVYCNNVPVRPEDLDRLKPGAWLNDEVICLR
jgi:Ulp1 family protease